MTGRVPTRPTRPTEAPTDGRSVRVGARTSRTGGLARSTGVPVGLRLLALAALGITLAVLRGPLVGVLALAGVLVVACRTGLPVRRTARSLLPVLVTAVVAGGYQWWTRGPAPALEVVADLLAVVLAAAVLVASTPSDSLLDAVTRAAGPLRRVGVRPEVVSLAVVLVLRAVPQVATTVTEVRDAARARGVQRDPRVWLTPAVVRVVGRSQDLGEALAARGVLD